MWCCRMMEKMSWTDHVKNEEVLHRVKKGRNILHSIKGRRANWIGHIWRGKCLLKQILKEPKKEIKKLRKYEEEDVSRHCVILRKLRDTGNSKRKH